MHIAFIHLALLKNSPTDFLKNALKTTYYKPGVFEECILGSADDRAKSNIFNYILKQIDFEFDMKEGLTFPKRVVWVALYILKRAII